MLFGVNQVRVLHFHVTFVSVLNGIPLNFSNILFVFKASWRASIIWLPSHFTIRYIHYVKGYFRPVLTKEAEKVISSYYQLQRRSATQNAGFVYRTIEITLWHSHFNLIIIGLFSARTTIRMLESLIRLAQGTKLDVVTVSNVLFNSVLKLVQHMQGLCSEMRSLAWMQSLPYYVSNHPWPPQQLWTVLGMHCTPISWITLIKNVSFTSFWMHTEKLFLNVQTSRICFYIMEVL